MDGSIAPDLDREALNNRPANTIRREWKLSKSLTVQTAMHHSRALILGDCLCVGFISCNSPVLFDNSPSVN